MDNDQQQHFEVDKMHAAHRQLSVAIRLHFEGDDPVAVLGLAGGPSRIFADLIEHRAPERSWDRRASAVVKLSMGQYFQVLREPANFLKHADKDPDGVLRWKIEDTEALMMAAIMNAGELDLLSPTASVYQLWYIAKHRNIFSDGFHVGDRAAEVFPGMTQMSDAQQRAAGMRRLLEFKIELEEEDEEASLKVESD
jgi:hypothetical protein